MYKVKKTIDIAVGHQLQLPYESKCNNSHGHNLRVTVYCKSENLNESGMVIDFSEIKKVVMNYDHKELPVGLTMEQFAKVLQERVPLCFKVEIWESEDNYACYEI